MMHSIQDYVRKINSRVSYGLSWWDVSSLALTAIILLIFTVFLYIKKEKGNIPVSYISSRSSIQSVSGTQSDSRPFASVNGKTYTFSWCNGSGNIGAKNKIYFSSENEAKGTGRTLSKLCQK